MLLFHLTSERSPFFSPLEFVGLWLLADKVRYEREPSLLPGECESGEMCVMGWENMWMRWVKT